jgi:hypothetical protein
MSVRLRFKVEVAVSSTPAEERDLGNGKFEVVVDSQNEGGAWKTTLAGAAVDVPIQLPNVASAKFIAVRTNPKNPNDPAANVTFKKGTIAGEAIVVAPLSTSKEGYLLFTTDTLTALFATNGSATVAMEISVFVAGD